MPNYIKALIFLLAATSIIMFLARDPLSSHYSKEEYRSYRNTWWFLAACLFLAPGIWIFYAIVLVTLLTRRYTEDIDRVSTYCFLLFAAPSIDASIPGFAGINKLFDLDMQRLLALVVLLPIFGKSLANGGLFNRPADKYVVLYIALSIILLYRDDNFTNSSREAIMMVVEVIIPYFVISRMIRSVRDFNRVFGALMFTLSLLSAEAVYEAARHWELYNSVGERLIGERVFRFSEKRAGLLRARSIFLSPIILGYAMVFLMALLMYFKPYFNKKMAFYVMFAICCAALLVTFSRAAWIGAVIFLAVYALLATGIARATWYMLLAGMLGSIVLIGTSFGQAILNLLPFFGGTERSDTFDYRARLMENGIIVIKRNPWFGAHDYLQSAEMEALRQGQGIIDTVNVYLAIAMLRGLVGLFLFVMIFIPSLLMIHGRIKKLPDSENDLVQVGRVLISFMAAALLMISTVSNADFVPVIYYLGAAFMGAWIGIYREYENRVRVSSAVMVR